MEFVADAVPDQVADDAVGATELSILEHSLHGGANVAGANTVMYGSDAGHQRRFGGAHQLFVVLRADFADDDGNSRVSDHTLVINAKIEAQNIARFEDFFGRRNTVDDFIVDGNTDDIREALITEERWFAAEGLQFGGCLVGDVFGRHPGSHTSLQALQYSGQHPAALTHGTHFSSCFHAGIHGLRRVLYQALSRGARHQSGSIFRHESPGHRGHYRRRESGRLRRGDVRGLVR